MKLFKSQEHEYGHLTPLQKEWSTKIPLGLQTIHMSHLPLVPFLRPPSHFLCLSPPSPSSTGVWKHGQEPTENTLGCPGKRRLLRLLFAKLTAWFPLAPPCVAGLAPSASVSCPRPPSGLFWLGFSVFYSFWLSGAFASLLRLLCVPTEAVAFWDSIPTYKGNIFLLQERKPHTSKWRFL
jgi:hypothetical protein